jgi:hypothetical protein
MGLKQVHLGRKAQTTCKDQNMKNFLAVFTGTPEANDKSGWNALTESARQERIQAGMNAWLAWMETHKQQIIVTGSPVGKTKRISAAGVADAHNDLCGYIVVSAESHEAAARLFEGHPHFAIFPGEAVEVMECLPVPGA